MDKAENASRPNMVRTRHFVHIGFSFLMFLVIVGFNRINDASVVGMIFRVASYTYGPLLGLYSFGLFVKNRAVKDKIVPVICLLSPVITYLITENSKTLFFGYVFDNELIIVNGLITFIGLYLISRPTLDQTEF
jgi:hypothetical protein